MKLSNILIGICLLILVSTGFMLFLVDGIAKYHPTVPSNYNKTFTAIQGNINELSSVTNQSDSMLTRIMSSNPITDFLGFFFGQGYQASRVLVNGVKLNGVILSVESL